MRRPKPIKDRDVRVVRAYLHDRLWEMTLLSLRDPLSRAFGLLAQTAFDEATYRRFSPRYTSGDVVRFVARARGRYGATGLDPLVAEHVVMLSIGGESAERYSRWRRVWARIRLLRALVEDLGLDEDGIDELIDQARVRADEWVSGRRGGGGRSRFRQCSS